MENIDIGNSSELKRINIGDSTIDEILRDLFRSMREIRDESRRENPNIDLIKKETEEKCKQIRKVLSFDDSETVKIEYKKEGIPVKPSIINEYGEFGTLNTLCKEAEQFIHNGKRADFYSFVFSKQSDTYNFYESYDSYIEHTLEETLGIIMLECLRFFECNNIDVNILINSIARYQKKKNI